MNRARNIVADELADTAPRRVGVRVYLFVLFAVVACVPLTLLSVVQGRRSAEEAASDTDRQTLAAATAFSLQVSLALTDYVRATESLAAQISAHGGLESNYVLAALEAHTLPHPEFIGSYAAHANGLSFAHYTAGVGRIITSNDYTNRDYYQELQRTGRPAVSRVQMGRVTGSPDIQIVAPLRDATGQMTGFVCTSVNILRLSERARVFAHGLTRGRILVLDKERRVIADSTLERATLRDVSSSALYVGSDEPVTRGGWDEGNALVRASVVPVADPSRGWSVIASVPLEVVADKTTTSQRVVLLVALAAMAFALALAAFLTLKLAAPLRALARSATQIAAGDSQQLPLIPQRAPRELAQVTEAVRRMVVALRKFAGGLQVLVDERTQELQAANVELAQTLGKLELKQTVLREDLAQARHFQERLLPKLGAPWALEVVTHFRPLEQVGGDIYDLLQLSPTKYRVFLADATGHGVQAAMRTIVIKFEYDRIKHQSLGLQNLLGNLNRRLIELFPEGELHCAATCADIDLTPTGAELTICSGGGAPALLASANGLQEVYVPGPLLGVTDVPFDEPRHVSMTSGTSIILSTDGLFEQMNDARQRFDSALDHEALRDLGSAQERMTAIVQQFDAFLSTERRTDDVTFVVIHVPRGEGTDV